MRALYIHTHQGGRKEGGRVGEGEMEGGRGGKEGGREGEGGGREGRWKEDGMKHVHCARRVAMLDATVRPIILPIEI